jgi:hypothetical protein
MKSGRYGKYKGVEYKIKRDMDNNIKILTKNKKEIDQTFVDLFHSGVYSKTVNPYELLDCVRIVPYGIIDGDKVRILKEKENYYQVGTDDLIIGSRLKLPRVDRDTWLGWVPKNEVRLIEEKTPINPEDL